MKIIKNEEAQFMLLAGFIIALGLVIMSALLSNIIFQGNMAGEAGADPVKYEIVNLMAISADEMKSAYRNVTALGGSNTQKINNFSKQMQNFNDNLSKIYALRGEGVKVSNDTSNWNNTMYANFTDNGMAVGATNWTVIENVKDSNIIVNLTTNGMLNISLKNLTTSWINLTGTGNFSFKNTSVVPYSINFNNGANVAGRFNITGNTSNNRTFIRARDFILNATVTLSTSRMR
ncbi:MAG: hypothetical protein WC568_06855, partial [Candidatus Methanoperedens sp.]